MANSFKTRFVFGLCALCLLDMCYAPFLSSADINSPYIVAQQRRRERLQPRSALHTLTIIRTGKGMGSITVTPSGQQFRSGTIVNLMAVPNDRSTFVGWQGGCYGISPECKVSMDSDITVKARFELAQFTIVTTAGRGGSILPEGAVSVSHGTDQTFKIQPAPKHRILDVKADGISLGPVNTYTFSGVIANHTITATFAPITYVLAVQIVGRGRGTITTAPPGNTFNAGTVLNLTATPDAHSYFEGWTGACAGISPACTITMNTNMSVGAIFREGR